MELSEAPLNEEPVWYYLSVHEEIPTHPYSVSISLYNHCYFNYILYWNCVSIPLALLSCPFRLGTLVSFLSFDFCYPCYRTMFHFSALFLHHSFPSTFPSCVVDDSVEEHSHSCYRSPNVKISYSCKVLSRLNLYKFF